MFGVADEDKGDGLAVEVYVAGEAAPEAKTSLGAGDSRVIATDINQASAADQCRLIRIDRPDGSEHVVGTCDEDGNLAVQPRASRDASAQYVYRWQADTAVAVGTKIRSRCANRVDDPGGTGNGEWIVYYECIVAGTTANAVEPDLWTDGCRTPDISKAWAASMPVVFGTIVRSGENGYRDRLFRQMATGTNLTTGAGPGEPGWDYTPGNTTNDGTAVWMALAPTASVTAVIADGTAVWACRTAAAIHSYSLCNIERNAVQGSLGPAIHLTSDSGAVPPGGANRSRIEKNYVLTSRDVGEPLLRTVSGATNANPIVITTSAEHLFNTGDTVLIEGVLGNTAANGMWTLTRLVTFTSGGNTATLPATPLDGQTHAIKSGGAFTNSIAGNGNNIDGATPYNQATNGECTTVRYSSAVGQWEILSR